MIDTEKTESLIGQTDLFSELNDMERKYLARKANKINFAAGELIFKQGDAAESLYLVQEGEVELARRIPGDDAQKISHVSSGDILGDGALLSNSVRMLSATAISDVRLLAFDRAALNEFILSSPTGAMKVYLQYALRLCARIRGSNAGDGKLAADPHRMGISAVELAPHKATLRYRQMITNAPFFDAFSEEEREQVIQLFQEYHLEKGQRIFTQNTPGASCFIIARGAVEIIHTEAQATSRLAVLGPGRMFGEMCLLDGGLRGATGVVREKAVILEMSADAFHTLLQSGSQLALKFLIAINRNLANMLQKSNSSLVVSALNIEPKSTSDQDTSSEEIKIRQDQHRIALVEKIRDSVIGDNIIMEGPFGPCRMVYADYTATGRSLSFIEEFIYREVMPYYANTHTESSGTGLQTTRLREDARSIILDAVGAGDDDVLIFTGSGATGAIDKIISVLGLKLPQALDDKYHFLQSIPENERPVVFVGPYEHHSNDVTWRMSIADTVMIMEDKEGRIDLEQLERELIRYADRELKIGSFSAASNVTGIITDDVAIATLLHQYGALSFWDFAAAAPYVNIEMNPQSVGKSDEIGDNLAYKDAIFISPHKFIGGPGTPGILIAKKALFKNKVPTIPGGGTVAYVSTKGQAFLEDPVHREEGGTPAIIESVRAGLVFQLKESVGSRYIEQLEHQFVERAIKAWSDNPNIWILGNPELKRLSIISLVIRYGDQFLHWNYVVALLNDLFGIQARGGCSCAGPYGHRLFGIGPELSESYQCEISKGFEVIKPGWVRVNFNYFISETVFNYMVSAIDLVATHGWKLLPQYRFSPETAMWTHWKDPPEPVLSLNDLEYHHGELEVKVTQTTEPDETLETYLERGRKLLENPNLENDAAEEPTLPDDVQTLRWFPLPSEIVDVLKERQK